MTVSAADAVEHDDFAAVAFCLRSRSEIELDVFPGIAALRLQAQGSGRLVSTMDHAIFAAAVPRDAVHDPIFLPLHFLEQFRVARVMRVSHQITRAFPAANVARRDGPG